MNKTESAKYGLSPEHIGKQSLLSKRFTLSFNFDCIKISKQVPKALDQYDKTLYLRKGRNLEKIFK